MEGGPRGNILLIARVGRLLCGLGTQVKSKFTTNRLGALLCFLSFRPGLHANIWDLAVAQIPEGARENADLLLQIPLLHSKVSWLLASIPLDHNGEIT